MRRNESDRINDYFGTTIEDWTPASARNAAFMLFAPASLDPEVSRLCEAVLSEAELDTAERFVIEDEKDQFIQRRAFRRFCGARALGSHRIPLSEIIFDETEKGLPYVRDSAVWFSFSSCRFGFIGAWSFTHGIGVDIEDQTRNLETTELAGQYFSKAEAKLVAEAGDLGRMKTFFQLWSLKESALKSVGEGLPFGLDAFEFNLSPTPRVRRAPGAYGGPEYFDPHLIEGKRTCAALVTHRL